MMCRHFALSSELTGAIAKRLPLAKNQLSVIDSFFNQFVIYFHFCTIHIFVPVNAFYLYNSQVNMMYDPK